MDVILDLLVSGIAGGAVLGVAALGSTSSFRISRSLDLAVGPWMVLAVVTAAALARTVPVPVAVVAGLAVSGLASLAAEVAVLGPSGDGSRRLVASFAVAVLLHGLLGRLPPGESLRGPVGEWSVGPLTVAAGEGLAVAAFLVVGAVLTALLYLTPSGAALRAVAADEDLAQATGVRPLRPAALAAAVAGVTAGAAGLLLAITRPVTSGDGLLLSFVVCTAVLAGRPGSLAGSMAGSLLVGLVLVGVSSLVAPGAGLAAVLVFLALILVLVPEGLGRGLAA